MAFRSAAGNSAAANSVGIANASNAVLSIAVGDILVFHCRVLQDPDVYALTLPTGFTEWYQEGNGSRHWRSLSWKRATSADVAGVTYTVSSSASNARSTQAEIAVYSGRIATGDPLDIGSSTAYVTPDATVRGATITPASGSDVIWAGDGNPGTHTLSVPAGMNSRASAADATEGIVALGDLLNVAASATGDKDGTAGASCERKHAFMAALKMGAISPTLTITAITAITENSAASGGWITDPGDAEVTERGVCWNTSGTPTIADSHTSD